MSNKINTAAVAVFLTLVAAPQLAFAQAPSGHRAERHHHVAPSTLYIPSDARGSVTPYGATEGGDYTPSVPTGAPDFQDGSRG